MFIGVSYKGKIYDYRENVKKYFHECHYLKFLLGWKCNEYVVILNVYQYTDHAVAGEMLPRAR